jgi:hypothetical protein
MKIKIINKRTGYFVGFGQLVEPEINLIKRLGLQDGTYQIEGMKDYLGI